MTGLPQNLRIIENLHDVASPIGRMTTVHATNGTYAYDADLIVPTTLAGFQLIADNNAMCKEHHVFLIGVNSDASMKAIGADTQEDQQTRALKVAVPLALQHPDRTIAVAFYDEETPEEFYRTLKNEIGADLYTLHKWGYGTTPDAPKIVGAEYFERVLAFPLPNDIKPVCYDKTPVENQPEIGVFKLTEKVGPYGPYLSTTGKIMFPVNDPSLKPYTLEAHFRLERFITTSAAGLTVTKAPTPDQP